MIKNERQYRISKAQADKLDLALTELQETATEQKDVHPLLIKAEQEGINSQLSDLRAEMKEYEELKAGKFEFPTLDQFISLPLTLIKARIAKGLTQKEFAILLGLKEQQIQKYESTEYSNASLATIKEIAEALGVKSSHNPVDRSSGITLSSFINRLKKSGLDRDLIMNKMIPASLSEQLRVNEKQINDALIYQAADYIGKIFGWSAQDIFGGQNLQLNVGLAPARLKVATNANEKRVDAYLIYAHYLALTLGQSMKKVEPKVLSDNPFKTRKVIVDQYGSINLPQILQYLWDIGMLILPLNDTGAFHGAYFRDNYKHMIVLKQKTSSSSRWAFDALHEAYHSLQNPKQPNLLFIEHGDFPKEKLSDEEIEASQFAGAVLLGKNPQALVEECIDLANQDIPMLKSAVVKIATKENVPLDSLANYVAFRLSLEGHNWWGTANNLQNEENDPFSITKDVLLKHIDLSRLSDPDIQLIQRALI